MYETIHTKTVFESRNTFLAPNCSNPMSPEHLLTNHPRITGNVLKEGKKKKKKTLYEVYLNRTEHNSSCGESYYFCRKLVLLYTD